MDREQRPRGRPIRVRGMRGRGHIQGQALEDQIEDQIQVASRARGRPPLQAQVPTRERQSGQRGRPRGGITGRYDRIRERANYQQVQLQASNSVTDYTQGMIAAANEFDVAISDIQFRSCLNCNRRAIELRLTNGICSTCNSINRSIFTDEMNNMNPGHIPDELRDLTYMEQILIAQINPIMQVYKLRGQQFAFKGNCISFRQDIRTYTRVLPHVPSQIPVLIFTKETPSGVASFRARRDKVERALRWLKRNNQYYREEVEISQEHLSQIPVDGDLTPMLRTCIIRNDQDNEQFSDVVQQSFVPLLDPILQQQQINSSFNLEVSSDAYFTFIYIQN